MSIGKGYLPEQIFSIGRRRAPYLSRVVHRIVRGPPLALLAAHGIVRRVNNQNIHNKAEELQCWV